MVRTWILCEGVWHFHIGHVKKHSHLRHLGTKLWAPDGRAQALHLILRDLDQLPGLTWLKQVGKRHECIWMPWMHANAMNASARNADDSIWFDMIWLARLLASLDFKALVHHLGMRGCTGVPSNLSFTFERGHPQEGLGQKEKTVNLSFSMKNVDEA